MSLVTPDFGLVVWMALIFGIVLFLLARYGFPIITKSVEERNERINSAIQQAKEAEERIINLTKEQEKILEETRAERNAMLKEAALTRQQIISDATSDARVQTKRMIEKAKAEIDAEKELALKEVRLQMAEMSLQIAEKVIRKSLDNDKAQLQYIDRLIDEMSNDITRKNC